MYLWKMGLSIETQYFPPRIYSESLKCDLDEIFTREKLHVGKTVLIAPYSTCLGNIDTDFWKPIVSELIDHGYTVVTNCVGEQIPLNATKALSLSFDMLIPFLNKAGFFIGFRSGICDVVSSAQCKMIVLHSYKSKQWGDGNALSYVGIKNMGLISRVKEYIVNQHKDDWWIKIQKSVVEDVTS